MATYNVSFQCDRHGNRRSENVTIPDCVPRSSRKMAIKSRLRVMGWPDACDVVIMEKPEFISAVECGGLPAGVDILAAGF